MSAEKVRLSLNVSPQLNDTLEALANTTHTTKSDVLRKAIALMQVAVEAKDNGQAVGIVDKLHKRLVREIVGV